VRGWAARAGGREHACQHSASCMLHNPDTWLCTQCTVLKAAIMPRQPIAEQDMRAASSTRLMLHSSLPRPCPAVVLGAKFVPWQLQAHLEELQQYVDYKGLVAIMAAIKVELVEQQAGGGAWGRRGAEERAGGTPAAAVPRRRIIPVTMAAAVGDPLVPIAVVPGAGVEPLLGL
jgi:hypothetical protein